MLAFQDTDKINVLVIFILNAWQSFEEEKFEGKNMKEAVVIWFNR